MDLVQAEKIEIEETNTEWQAEEQVAETLDETPVPETVDQTVEVEIEAPEVQNETSDIETIQYDASDEVVESTPFETEVTQEESTSGQTFQQLEEDSDFWGTESSSTKTTTTVKTEVYEQVISSEETVSAEPEETVTEQVVDPYTVTSPTEETVVEFDDTLQATEMADDGQWP